VIIIGDTSVSDDLYLVRFCCNLERCLGACCVAGDAGAPLEEEEISILEDELDDIRPFMTEQGIRTVEETGVFDYDIHAKFVTPLVNGGECAFAVFESGIAYCAIENAFYAGKTRFLKPVSCHLYPVRITEYKTFQAVNYQKWAICKPALKMGNREGIPLYRFLKNALVRKYGEAWYKELEAAIDQRIAESGTH
jgi:hypothetical protein